MRDELIRPEEKGFVRMFTHKLSRSCHVMAFSARTPAELDGLAAGVADYIVKHPERTLQDVCRALPALDPRHCVGRTLVSSERHEAVDALRNVESCVHGYFRSGEGRVAFLFPGLGEQYAQMGGGLYHSEGVFRECVDTCCRILKSDLDVDLARAWDLSRPEVSAHAPMDLRRMLGRSEPGRGEQTGSLDETRWAQPATFVIEYALAQLWMSWGVQPDAMLGYSVGEYVAACIAGVMSLPDALRLIVARARLIEGLPKGAMLAVPHSPARVKSLLLGSDLSLAAVNGDSLCVVAGSEQAVDAMAERLKGDEQPVVRIQTTHAFHSTMMEPIAEELRELVATFSLSGPRIPYVSNVTGTWISKDEATNPRYWSEHLSRPVRFSEGIRALWQEPARVFLEVGPGRSLSALALHNAPDDGRKHAAFASMRSSYESTPDDAVMLGTLGRLWLSGVAVDWDGVLGASQEGPSVTELRRELEADLVTASAARAAVPSPKSAAPVPPQDARPRTRRRRHLFSTYVGPKTDVESSLVETWQDVLNVEGIGVNDNFFELGGHSLMAIAIIDRWEAATGVRVPLRTLFEGPTVAELACHIAGTAVEQDEGRARLRQPANADGMSGASSGLPYVLPNGLEIEHQNKAETDHFYHDIFEQRSYVRHLAAMPENACVFDVGANIGLFSLFVHTIHATAKIYAFEPCAPTFRILKKNLLRHRVNVALFDVGLSDSERWTELTFYPRSSGMSSVYGDRGQEEDVLRGIFDNQMQTADAGMQSVKGRSDELLEERLRSETLPCRLRTLSDIMSEQGVTQIDLLKIDVQKSEFDVLMGVRDEHWSRIQNIVIEVHDLDGRLQLTKSFLNSRGYEVEVEQDDLYHGTGIYLIYANRRSGRAVAC